MKEHKILAATPKTDDVAWERWQPTHFGDASAKAAAGGTGRPAANGMVAAGAELDALRAAAREEGYRAGFDAGHAEGLDAGREAAKAEGRALATQLGNAISRFDAGVAQLERDRLAAPTPADPACSGSPRR